MSTDVTIKCFSSGSVSSELPKISMVELDNLVDAALEVFHKIAFEFSRFNDQGELARVNELAQQDFVEISDDFLELLQFSMELARFSDGLYDPTVIDLLEGIGYNSSLQNIQIETHKKNDRAKKEKLDFLLQNRASWQEIEIDKNKIKLQPGQRLEFGGIGKGYAIDKAAELLSKYSENFLIDAGGDVFAKGKNMHKNKNWILNLKVFYSSHKKSKREEKILRYKVDPKGESVTSSGGVFRKFGRFDHILNPKLVNVNSQKNAVVQTFVINRRALVADGLSTLLFLGGKDFLEKIKEKFHSDCAVIYSDGKIFLTETFKIY